MNPEYPVYIISKGRWDKTLTAYALNDIGVPFRIVVEPKELNKYSLSIDRNKIIVLPDNFSEQSLGSIPVRNWVWEHAISEGHKRHWILDDNISCFLRLNRNKKRKVKTGTIFKCCEDFVNRYDNVALAGLQYNSFIPEDQITPAFIFNTRIYSCILIKNDIPYRWRGRYNEDTDLSIRVLKDGLCTILFHAFLQDKATTMTMAGGNTDTIYNTGDERLEFAKSLEQQHPDCVKIIRRFGRWHHSINLRKFKRNRLIKNNDIEIVGNNEYGMVLSDK